MATGDLTDLPTVKANLKITDTSNDAVLQRMITEISAFIPNQLQRRGIFSATYTDLYTGNGKERQLLRDDPIQSVASVAWQGTSLTAGDPIAGTPGFYIDGRGKAVCLIGYCFPLGYPVQITYTAGWATVPPDIAGVCIDLVSENFRRREHIGQVSHSQGGVLTTAYDMKAMGAFIAAKLGNYLRVAPV